MKRKLLSTAVALALLSTSAVAQESLSGLKWYGGVTAGNSGGLGAAGTILQPDVSDGGSYDGYLITDYGSFEDDNSTSFFVGARVNKNFAFEFGKTDLGSFSESSDVTWYVPRLDRTWELPMEGDIEADLDGWEASVIGIIPVHKHFEFYAKAGVLFWDLSASQTLSFTETFNRQDVVYEPGDAYSKVSGGDDGRDFFYGIGVNIPISERIGGRIAWNRYKLDDEEIDTTQLGLYVNFN